MVTFSDTKKKNFSNVLYSAVHFSIFELALFLVLDFLKKKSEVVRFGIVYA